MTCQNLQNKLLNIVFWVFAGEYKFGEQLFQSTRHFGECLKKMVSHTA
jgi:hypothetical protein